MIKSESVRRGKNFNQTTSFLIKNSKFAAWELYVREKEITSIALFERQSNLFLLASFSKKN